jgi:hypothetical protein
MRVLFEASELADREADQLFVSALRELVPGCAVLPLYCSRLEALREECSPPQPTSASSAVPRRVAFDVSALVTRFRHSSEFDGTRSLALKLLNRVDLTGTFRLVDREVFFQIALLDVAGLLLEAAPDVVVFRITPHKFVPCLVSAMAHFMGIEVLHFQPCSMAPAMIPKLVSGRPISLTPFSTRESGLAEEVLSIFRQQFTILSEGLPPRYMEIQRESDNRQRGVLARLRALTKSLGWFVRRRFPESIDFSGHGKAAGFAWNALRVLMTRSLQRRLQLAISRVTNSDDFRGPYCVYAMHYEPERTSLPDGLPVDSQFDAILHVRAVTPPDQAVVVKEHYSQQSSALRGFLGRSPWFYELVSRLPNTVFASAGANLRQLARGSSAVFTLTGTIAIEAALSRIPVFYFGSPWWGGLPGTSRVDFSESNVATVEPTDVIQISAFLETKVLDDMIPGLAGETVEKLVSRYGWVPKGLRVAEAAAMARCVVATVGRVG